VKITFLGKKDVTVADFDVLHVLGAGAFGTVLLVEEKETSKH